MTGRDEGRDLTRSNGAGLGERRDARRGRDVTRGRMRHDEGHNMMRGVTRGFIRLNKREAGRDEG